jgi:segregation and condensation protein B
MDFCPTLTDAPALGMTTATTPSPTAPPPAPDRVELSALSLLESLLFVASGPVSAARLAAALETTPAAVEELLRALEADYAGRGLRLQRSGGLVQLTTAAEAGATIERFLGLEVTTRLSQAALEVLAIVAYLQPATRPQIDQLRGVNSDGALRSLLSKGLVEEVGRLEKPGRPILYGTTPEFLQAFGLNSVAEMPGVEEEE